jgi:hypothetical protein
MADNHDNLMRVPDNITVDFLQDLAKRINETKKPTAAASTMQRPVMRKSVTFKTEPHQTNVDDVVVAPNECPDVNEPAPAECVGETGADIVLYNIFGLALPKQTLFLVIAVIVICLALYFYTAPKDKKKKKEEKHEKEDTDDE